MKNFSDMHIHTLVSDGINRPDEILTATARLGLKRISITDHDAIGAYRNFDMDVFSMADSLGLTLITGIELDTEYQGYEVHLLGYGFDLNNKALNDHLETTQHERREKTTQQIAAVNAHFGRIVVDPDQVFISFRDTLMKPHLIHEMLDQKLFSEYREAASWLKNNIRVPATIHKPSIQEAVSLLIQAGGKPVLAHPGYLVKEAPFSLETLLEDVVPLGLAGLETEYPYWTPQQDGKKPFPHRKRGEKMVGTIRQLANKFKLETTRGSDAHDIPRLEFFAEGSLL